MGDLSQIEFDTMSGDVNSLEDYAGELAKQ